MGADLLEDQRAVDGAQAAAALVLGDEQSEETEIGQFTPGGAVHRDTLPGHDGVQGEVVVAEPGHGLLQLDLSGIQPELHQRPPGGRT